MVWNQSPMEQSLQIIVSVRIFLFWYIFHMLYIRVGRD